MNDRRLPLVHGALLAAVAAVAAHAHDDDPKARNVLPPYAGPGWRASQGGIAGLDFPAESVFLQSWVTLDEFSAFAGVAQGSANDCWTYVSPSGREYAMIGLEMGTGFVEVTDPADARIIAFKPGPESTWRDIKTYQQFAYAVSEGGEGIQVFDLADIDGGVVRLETTVTEGGTESTHNVALNTESGFLYRTGGGPNGLRIYDLADPAAPEFVASWPDRYVHDAQVVTMAAGQWADQEIAFCCSGFNGGGLDTGIDILDVTEKDDIQLLARYEYPAGAYSHQAWLSEDQQYLFLNDEADESSFGLSSTMHVIDVSDLENPVQATAWTNGVNAITHNLYVRGDRAYAANYSSGLRVFDVSDPLSPSEVAFFDTAPFNGGLNFNNLWSTCPFLDSGVVVGSDRQHGLFVWVVDPELIFSYPEGRPDLLDPAGGTVRVRIENFAGELDEDTATLHYRGAGVESYAAVALVPVESDLFDAVFPPFAVCGAGIEYYFSAQTIEGVEVRDPIGAPVSAWSAVAASSETVAFGDDFESDQGWTVENGAGLSDGAWERGVPAGGGDLGDPPADADGSGQCYLTDNVDGNSDVDGGTTTLISPLFDATGEAGLAHLEYARWYSNNYGASPGEDVMIVELSNDGGESWVLVETVEENVNRWVSRSLRVNQFLAPSGAMRVRFTAGDLGGLSIVEAGVDAVRIVHYLCDVANDPDIDGDGIVDVNDLVLLILAWGECPPGPCAADVDGDGEVDVEDLIALITNWG